MNAIHKTQLETIDVPRTEVTRLLGYRNATIPDRVSELIADVETECQELVAPAAVYRYMKRHDLAHSPYLYHVDAAALCLVTIGATLEARVDEHRHSGDLSRALILDAFGSAAAEAAAGAAQSAIEHDLAGQQRYCGERFSPGYACWDVKEQSWIVPALDGASIGVSLTEHHMMVPRKSVSFAALIADTRFESRHHHSCELCGKVDCHYQRPPIR